MKRNIDEIQKSLKEYFEKHSEIEIAYIFGSVAKRKNHTLSDIDIAIFLDNRQIKSDSYRYGYKAEILADLFKLLNTNKVDLVILNKANPLLRHRVLYFGKLIYSKDEKCRIRFQIDTINKYNDFKQLMRIHSKSGGRK